MTPMMFNPSWQPTPGFRLAVFLLPLARRGSAQSFGYYVAHFLDGKLPTSPLLEGREFHASCVKFTQAERLILAESADSEPINPWYGLCISFRTSDCTIDCRERNREQLDSIADGTALKQTPSCLRFSRTSGLPGGARECADTEATES